MLEKETDLLLVFFSSRERPFLDMLTSRLEGKSKDEI
jgi:hypothetical protein